MIHISHQTKSVVVPYSSALAALFPHGARFTWNGDELIVVPHGIDETRMLRNLGLPVPAPIDEHYDFPSADGKRPFAKQVLTAASMMMNPHSLRAQRHGHRQDQGVHLGVRLPADATGGASACWWWRRCRRCDFTWAREIFNTLPHLKVRVLYRHAERRRKLLAAEGRHLHHQPRRREGALQGAAAAPTSTSSASTRLRPTATPGPSAPRSPAGWPSGRKYVWGMTGSPTPSAPTDAFGLAHLITPDDGAALVRAVPAGHHGQVSPVQVGAAQGRSRDGGQACCSQRCASRSTRSSSCRR